MYDPAGLAANSIIVFLRNSGVLRNDSLSWDIDGMELRIASEIRSAYGEPDETIPFTEEDWSE